MGRDDKVLKGLKNVEKRLAKIDREVRRLRDDIDGLRGDVDGLRGDIDGLKMRVDFHDYILRQQRNPFLGTDYSPVDYPESQWNSITKPDYK